MSRVEVGGVGLVVVVAGLEAAGYAFLAVDLADRKFFL